MANHVFQVTLELTINDTELIQNDVNAGDLRRKIHQAIGQYFHHAEIKEFYYAGTKDEASND